MNYACKRLKRSEKKLTVRVPGSKSVTNRALLLASLARGESELFGMQSSGDAASFLECVQKLGVKVEREGDCCRVLGGNLLKNASVNVGSAGTAARFLTALLGLSDGEYFLDSSEQMKKRPMKPLLDSLVSLGASVTYLGEEGHFPFVLKGGKGGGRVKVDVSSSSQFLSALLAVAPVAGGLTVETTGSHGMAYVEMTVKMMEEFGVKVRREGNVFIVPVGEYRPLRYFVEPDVSAACYFYALAALTGNTVAVEGVSLPSLQGDTAFLQVLKEMGAKVDGCTVTGRELHGVTVDMSAFSDQAITLACISPFADSPTLIKGIGHIRLQESDRLSAMATELKKLGCRVETGEDFIRIFPSVLHGGIVKTYDDHRMAMGFSLIGTRVEGIVIEHAECCQKTFREYFDVLDELRESL